MKNNIRSASNFGLIAFLICGAFAHAASVIPPKFLPGDKTIRLSSGDQVAPEIASGGNISLAIWEDKRALPGPLQVPSTEFETSSDIYAVRIDANGQFLDRVPLVVTQEAAMQSNPQVVWNGTNWLVLFESIDVGGTGFFAEDSLEAVRVSPAGIVLDPTPIKIRNISPTGSSWTAASDGVDWFVAGEHGNANSALGLLRVTAAGQVLQGPKIVVPSTYFLRSTLKLAYANGTFLLTWSEFSDTAALRFDSNLAVLDSAHTIVGSELLDLTSSGTQFYAIWGDGQILGSRISSTGQLLDGGVLISGNHSPDAFTPAAVSWDGTNFKVTWSSGGKLYLSRVSPSGTVLDPGGILIPGAMSGPTASTGAGDLQVVWSVLQAGEFNTLTAHISPNNTAGSNIGLGVGAPAQTRGDAAMGAAGAMVVFRSDFAGRKRILAQPLDLQGRAILPNPIHLESGSNTSGPNAPSVAWNGTVYLATWTNPSGVVAQRINQDGTLVDSVPFLVMPGNGTTEVSAVGDVFLVIARQLVNHNIEIIVPAVARIQGSTGAVLDPAGFAVGNSFCVSVSVTAVNNRWLAVFRSNTTHDNPIGSTYGTFVNADGSKSATFFIFGPSGMPGNGIVEVAVASDGTNALALQSAPVTSASETDLVGVIVNADGTHRPAVTLTPWMGNQSSPHAVWNGTYYVAVFNDQINRFAPFTIDAFDTRSDLFGMRISADGNRIDPMGFVFSASDTAESWPNVTAGNGLTLLTGSVVRNLNLDAYRFGYEIRGTGGNQWPVAVASANREGGDIPLSINFSSAGSVDLDGSIASYFWDFDDGATSSSPNPLHTYTMPGKYVATLTVTDDLGSSTTNTVPLDVTAPNQPPVAKFVVSPPTGQAPLSVVLTSDESYDPDGSIGNRQWKFSDGGDYFGDTAFHTFERPGTYTVSLTVFDDRGGQGTSRQTVVVQ